MIFILLVIFVYLVYLFLLLRDTIREENEYQMEREKIKLKGDALRRKQAAEGLIFGYGYDKSKYDKYFRK